MKCELIILGGNVLPKLRCHLQLATYRSASLVTVCGDVCQTPESLLVLLPELAHLRTIYFALYKCTHYYYYKYQLSLHSSSLLFWSYSRHGTCTTRAPARQLNQDF